MFDAQQPDNLDQRLLDRLVDGELSLAEQRQAIRGIEQWPDGWRRCALAFLEAQAWGKEFRRVLADQAADDQAHSVVPTGPVAAAAPVPAAQADGKTSPWMPGHWQGWFAMAASFLVAFSLGLLLRRPAGELPPTLPPIVRSSGAFGEVAGTTSAGTTTTGFANAGGLAGQSTSSPAVRLMLTSDGDAETSTQTVELPVLDAAELQRRLRESPGVFPEELRRQLGRMGHRVRVNRELLPVELPDGRRLEVPIDRADIRYVGHEYQ